MTWSNDWKFKTFWVFTLAVITLQVILVELQYLGLDIPIVRQVSGFIFITFIPGLLILRILKVHDINPVESAAYTVGLSLAFTMFWGLVIDLALPLINISRPLDTLPVTVFLALADYLLLAGAFIRDKKYVPGINPGHTKLNINGLLFLLLLLLLVVLGVLLLNVWSNNLVLFICLILIAVAVALAAWRKFITPGLFPLTIFVISLCLLYQTTLISPYLVGTDIYAEYQSFQLVHSSGIWDQLIRDPINSCLSIVMLAPVYSQSLNIDGIWVFKAVYPLLFSLVPLIIYRFVRIQTNSLTAFLSAFFFMAVPTFMLEMIGLCRQQIAELFFALLILLFVDRRLAFRPKFIIMMIIIPCIAVSHYAMGLIGFAYFGVMLILIFIMRSTAFRSAWSWLTQKIGGLPHHLSGPGAGSLPLIILFTSFIFYFIFSIIWYSLVASGISLEILVDSFNIITRAVSQQAGGLLGQLPAGVVTVPGQSDILVKVALGLDFMQASLAGKIFRVLQYITQILIIIGCLRLLIKPKGLNFRVEYIALSLISFFILAACILLPGFAARLNTTRWYHITLITLSPFLILGAEALWSAAKYICVRFRSNDLNSPVSAYSRTFFKAFTLIILVPYFIFTSGIIFEAAGREDNNKVDIPFSIALSSYRLDLVGILNRQDVAAAGWLVAETKNDINIYADYHAAKVILLLTQQIEPRPIPVNGGFNNPCYIYFTAWNNINNQISFAEAAKPGLSIHLKTQDIPGLVEALSKSSRIYTNGGAIISLTE